MNWRNYLLGAFGFALAIMFWPGQAGAAEPSRWAFLAASVPIGLFAISIKPDKVLWLILALLGWSALTFLWADVFYDAANWWFGLVLLAGCFAIGHELGDLDWFYKGVAVGLIAQLPICVLQAFHYYPVIAVMPDGQALPSGLFVNPSMLGEACAPVAVVMLVKRQWLWAAGVAAVLLLSQNRSGIISFGLCSLLWVALQNRRMIWLAILTAAPVAYLGLIKGVDPFSSLTQRVDIWKDAWAGFVPLGHGIGQFYVDFPMHNDAIMSEVSPTWVLTAHAHNDILEWAFELGIPGLILIGAIAFIVFRNPRATEGFGLFAICITAMVGFPWHMPFTAAVGAIMAGYATRARDLVRGDVLHSGSMVYGRRQFARAVEPIESLPTVPA